MQTSTKFNIGDTVRVLPIVKELYEKRFDGVSPSPGIVPDMTAMVGKEYKVTSLDSSNYVRLNNEFYFNQDWVELVDRNALHRLINDVKSILK